MTSRRDLLKIGVLFAGAPMLNRGQYSLFGRTKRAYSARAIELIGRSPVLDMLGLPTMDWQKLDRWMTDPSSLEESDSRTLRESGISVFHPAVELPGADPYKDTTGWLTGWNQLMDARPDVFARADCAGDLEQSKTSGRIGILMGMQNSDHFRSIEDIAVFHGLGQRISQLTYNMKNRLGYGCIERVDLGLTGYGAEAIAEMNRIGMAVDVSHAGDRTTLDAIAASKAPVLITHSNCRAIAGHPRCKPDLIIRAMARSGSVMGITGVRAFVRRQGPATVEHVLDHFDHVIRLVGVEHVGIGSDTGLDEQRAVDSAGLNHPRRIFDLTEGLVRRRYSDRNIELILGGNFIRALGAIFETAAANNS